MKKKIIIIISAIVGFLLALGYIIGAAGWYPVALVNYRPVFRFDLDENVRAARQFYQARGLSQPELKIEWEGEEGEKNAEELRRNILATMIEDAVVNDALRDQVFQGIQDEAMKRVDEAMAQQKISEDFEKGVRLLYGWDVVQLKKRLMEPGARREVLEEKMVAEGVNFDEWFSEQKQKANVKVFFVGTWNKEKGTVE